MLNMPEDYKEDCIFCMIAKGQLQANVEYEDEHVMVIHDIRPQAPYHLLIIPKRHIPQITDVEDLQVLGHIISALNIVVKNLGLDKSGFRLVVNCGPDAGQEVYHLHIHVLGGRKLGWPPG